MWNEDMTDDEMCKAIEEILSTQAPDAEDGLIANIAGYGNVKFLFDDGIWWVCTKLVDRQEEVG